MSGSTLYKIHKRLECFALVLKITACASGSTLYEIHKRLECFALTADVVDGSWRLLSSIADTRYS